MSNRDPSNKSVLQSLYDVGERIHAALQEDDLDQFAQLTEQRAHLVDELRAYDHPAEVDPNWEELAEALRKQHQAIETVLSERHEELEDQLSRVGRQKNAQDQYAPPPSSQQSGVLNKDLQG